MTSRLAPRSRPGSLALTLATSLLTACGGDDAPEEETWSPDPAEVEAAVAAYQAQAIKRCSLDAVFPGAPLQAGPAPRTGFDDVVVRRLADPNLVWTLGDTRLFVSAFPGIEAGSDGTTVYNQRVSHTKNGQGFTAELEYTDGRCVIRVGDQVVFDQLLRKVRVEGVHRAVAQTGAARVRVIEAGQEPAIIGRVSAGAKLVDFSDVPRAIGDAIRPQATSDEALADQLAPLWQVTPEVARGLVIRGSTPFYQELLVPDGLALPPLTANFTGNGNAYEASVILTDAELAALRGATELRFVWAYAGSNANVTTSDRTTQLAIVLRRTGDLAYELSSITPQATAPKSDAQAAACALDRLGRIQRWAGAVPGGSYDDDVLGCESLTQDLPRAIAADANAARTALTFLGDDYRARAPALAPGMLTPSDGGPGFELARWDDFFAQLFRARPPQAGDVTSAPSRIVSGFLTSLATLDGRPLRAASRDGLVGAFAGRAFEAAGPRNNSGQDYRPLAGAAASRLVAALRDDELTDAVIGNVASLVADDSLTDIETSAALACLGGTALDGVRPTVTTLAQGAASSASRATYLINALRVLLGWSHQTGDVASIAATYCRPAFATWAATQVPASRPVCVYEGLQFDRNDYCAP